MTDWNALAEKHKLGTTDLDRTMALVCRELAGLVPQEVAESEPVRVPIPEAPTPIHEAALEGEEVFPISAPSRKSHTLGEIADGVAKIASERLSDHTGENT